MLDLSIDFHVRTTWSGGRHTVAENLDAALVRGLHTVCLVERVERTSTWVPAYVSEVRRARASRDLMAVCGVEARLLDEGGNLDLPRDLGGIEVVHIVTDHIPLGRGLASPAQARALVTDGSLRPEDLITRLVAATARAVDWCPRRPVVSRLFQVLSACGLSEHQVELNALRPLAQALAQRCASVTVDELWCCPSPRIVHHLQDHGVAVLSATGSRRLETVGQYDYVRDVAGELPVAA